MIAQAFIVINCLVSSICAHYCSPSLPTDQFSETRDGTGQHVTRVSVSMTEGSSLCLMSRDGRLNTVLTLQETRVHCHVKDQYQYTWPHVSVSCYCTCSPSQCQVPGCSTCYNLTSVSPPCHAHSSTHSTTCCSVRVTTPNPTLTALQLGHCSTMLQYRLQTFSLTGSVRSEERRVHLTSGATTVQHQTEAGGILVTMAREAGAEDSHLEDEWFIVTEDGRLSGARVNTGHQRDRSLPGWLRVKDDVPETPTHHLVSGGVRTETVDCDLQQFSADLSGLNRESGLEENTPHSGLYWDGQRGKQLIPFKTSSSSSNFSFQIFTTERPDKLASPRRRVARCVR